MQKILKRQTFWDSQLQQDKIVKDSILGAIKKICTFFDSRKFFEKLLKKRSEPLQSLIN